MKYLTILFILGVLASGLTACSGPNSAPYGSGQTVRPN